MTRSRFRQGPLLPDKQASAKTAAAERWGPLEVKLSIEPALMLPFVSLLPISWGGRANHC